MSSQPEQYTMNLPPHPRDGSLGRAPFDDNVYTAIFGQESAWTPEDHSTVQAHLPWRDRGTPNQQRDLFVLSCTGLSAHAVAAALRANVTVNEIVTLAAAGDANEDTFALMAALTPPAPAASFPGFEYFGWVRSGKSLLMSGESLLMMPPVPPPARPAVKINLSTAGLCSFTRTNLTCQGMPHPISTGPHPIAVPDLNPGAAA